MVINASTIERLSEFWEKAESLRDKSLTNLQKMTEIKKSGNRFSPRIRLTKEVNIYSPKGATILETTTNLTGLGQPPLFGVSSLRPGTNIVLFVERSEPNTLLELTLRTDSQNTHRLPNWGIRYEIFNRKQQKTREFSGDGSVSIKNNIGEKAYTLTATETKSGGTSLTLPEGLVLIESNLTLFQWAIHLWAEELN